MVVVTYLTERRDILKSMLAAGHIELWKEAVVRPLDFEETIFHAFDWFDRFI